MIHAANLIDKKTEKALGLIPKLSKGLKDIWVKLTDNENYDISFDEVRKYFDEKWYSEHYKDIGQAGVDPVKHYVEFGFKEGRNPSKYFNSNFYTQNYLHNNPELCPLVHFICKGRKIGLLPHPFVNFTWLERTQGVDAKLLLQGKILVDNLAPWFSESLYLSLHPDIHRAGNEALTHAFEHAVAENRLVHPLYVITKKEQLDLYREDFEVEFLLNSEEFIVARSTVQGSIAEQVIEQGRHDPQVFAPGAACIKNLRKVSAINIFQRENIDHRKLLAEFSTKPEVIILHPGLTVGGAEKYTAQLAKILRDNIGLSCSIITTDSIKESDQKNLGLSILEPIKDFHIVSLHEYFKLAPSKVSSLALLLMILAPKHVFVINSDIGFQTISQYGQTLTNVMKFYVSFFSETNFAEGGPYSARYLLDVIPHARVFSDNQLVLDKLAKRINNQFLEKFLFLPQPVEYFEQKDFEAVVQSIAHRRDKRAPARILWISRWTKHKATDVLIALAKSRNDIVFDVYGVPESETDFPSQENLIRNGVVQNIADLSFANYDAYLFTSYYEGMPNAVLEIASRGLPVISSDVGGLRELFDDRSLDYVSMSQSKEFIVKNFSAAIDRVLARSSEQVLERVTRARSLIIERHNYSACSKRLETLLSSSVTGRS